MLTMRVRRHTFATVAALIALISGGLYTLGLDAQGDRALGTAGGGRQQLTFIASAADGQPATDLTAAQVELRIDGKPRPMQSLRMVKIGSAAPEAAMAKKDVPPPFGTNPAEPSRTILLAIDEESIRTGLEKPIAAAITQFVHSLLPQDRVGVMTMPHGSINVSLTSTKSAVTDALANVAGRLPSTRDANEDACHALNVTTSLIGAIRSLGDGPATVVVFSSVLTAPGSTTTSQGATGAGGGGGRAGGTTTVSTCDFTTSDFQKVGAAAAAAHATVYVVQPEVGGSPNDTAGLRNLAGLVGSPLLNMSGGADGGLARITRESSAYYVAEFDFDAAERDGRSHHVDMKVTAPSVTVRGPSEVVFAKVTSAKPLAKDAVKEAKIYTDLELRVTAYALRGAADKINVLTVVQAVDKSVKFSSVSIGLVDSTNKMTVVSATPEELAKAAVAATLAVTPGNYRVHAAAVDASGRVGSADFQVNATLVSVGPMRLGGLTLASAATPGDPVSAKMEFHDEAEVIATFDLYGTTAGGLSLVFEIAETVDGPALQQIAPSGLSPTKEPDKFTVQATIPIKDLKPGDYVIRAVFGLEGLPPGKVMRTLRKVK